MIHKLKPWVCFALLLGLILPGVLYAEPKQDGSKNAEHILLRFKAETKKNVRENALVQAAIEKIKDYRIVPGMTRARIKKGDTVEAALVRIKHHPDVLYAEPDFMVYASAVIPNDPGFSKLYALNNTGQTGGKAGADINAPEAWDIITGGETVIAVIDSGLDPSHPDIAANVWKNLKEIPGNGIDDDNNGYKDDVSGWNFVNGTNNPYDNNGHGTHVSGTIAANGNNATGVVGVNWSAKIMPLKFLDQNGQGYVSGAIDALEYAVMMGVRISNNSWGSSSYSQALYDAIAAAGAAGHLFVAAAGNSGANLDSTPSYPAAYGLPNIISVAATDHNDLLASFSSYGALNADLGAPGVSIFSLYPGNSYATMSGTSMATPHVSGVAALLLDLDPTLTSVKIKNAILQGTDPLPSLAGKTVTGGRLNAYKAVLSLPLIDVIPETAKIAVGKTQQFTAYGGTAPYSWTIKNAAVGQIDSNTGLFTGLSAGVTTVSVTDSSGLKGNSGPVEVVEIAVTPENTTIGLGQQVLMKAAGGTAPYSWSTSDTAVASIDSVGFLTGVGVGTTTATATDSLGFSDTVTVTVSSISITPRSAIIAMGGSRQFAASGGLPPYVWSSANLSVGTIDSASGLFLALAPGKTSIIVSDLEGISVSSDIVEVRNIVISPANATLSQGGKLQFSASGGVGPYSWSVSDPNVASISTSGLLTALKPGSVIVTATDVDFLKGSSGPIIINALPALKVAPYTITVPRNGTVQFKASGGVAPYTWNVSNTRIGTINRYTGFFKARYPGNTLVILSDAAGNRVTSGTITVTR